MFTVCPKCALTLAVTAADLRAGQGYVRCGRCANVFNALLGLSEEAALDPASTQPNLALQLTQPPPNEHVAPGDDEENVVHLQLSPGEEPIMAPEHTDIGFDSEEAEFSESQGTGTFETIVLEGEGILQTEEFVKPEAIDSELAAVARKLATAEQQQKRRHIFGLEETESGNSVEPEATQDSIAVTAEQPHEPGRFWLWAGLCALLVLVLLAQVIHHWRNELAARPMFYQPLTRLYGALGVNLTPTWDLAQYDVRQLGAATDGSGDNAIRVRVSLANLATRPQPLPLIRLTLLDRYGKRVAARDLKPAEYLPKDQTGQIFMEAEQHIDTEIAVVDPGPDASSFELDVCLARAGGGLRCGGELTSTDKRAP